MTTARTVSDVLNEHVTLEIEGIDRMYLNLYVPILQSPRGIGHFWIHHRGHQFASSALMAPMTEAFVSAIKNFAKTEGIEVVAFKKGQRKDEVSQEYLARFPGKEGVLFIGKAQEKTRVARTERRRNPNTGQTYPWLVMSTAMVGPGRLSRGWGRATGDPLSGSIRAGADPCRRRWPTRTKLKGGEVGPRIQPA